MLRSLCSLSLIIFSREYTGFTKKEALQEEEEDAYCPLAKKRAQNEMFLQVDSMHLPLLSFIKCHP